VSGADPVALLFGGMEKLGPGSDADTLKVLGSLPRQDFRLVVDAGCGAGRQTLALARRLGTPVHAIDSHQPFLDLLERRAREAKLEHLVKPRRMDMKDIPEVFRDVDLLWSEGAAYNIGFGNALATWSAALAPGGLAVLSELTWLRTPPAAAAEFFRSGYPDMRSIEDNLRLAEDAGYRLLGVYTLPRHAWVDGYYSVLAPRAKRLLDHADAAVRAIAAETVREIEVFEQSGDSYGYVFYLLQTNR
jgi:cyclopropane fatty-acyl-phospholipid synthase-like methyltransferase